MDKFIELKDYEDQPILLNLSNVICFRPEDTDEGTMIDVVVYGKNDSPHRLFVKESYSQIAKQIKQM